MPDFCRLWLPSGKGSVSGKVAHDQRIINKDLQDYQHAKTVIDERQSLTEMQKEISDLQLQLTNANRKTAKAEQELVDAATPWAQKVKAELDAIDEHERLVALAKMINHLL